MLMYCEEISPKYYSKENPFNEHSSSQHDDKKVYITDKIYNYPHQDLCFLKL